MPREGFSPPQLFVSYGMIALGAWLLARHPASWAVVILDWMRLLVLALATAVPLYLLERRLSRPVRRESAAYPYGMSVLAALFGLSINLVAAANEGFARTPPRVVRVAVRGWESPKHASGPLLAPLLENDRFDPVIAVAESWMEPGATIRLAISPEMQEHAEGPGPHMLELQVAPGFLGVEYVKSVRLVTP